MLCVRCVCIRSHETKPLKLPQPTNHKQLESNRSPSPTNTPFDAAASRASASNAWQEYCYNKTRALYGGSRMR